MEKPRKSRQRRKLLTAISPHGSRRIGQPHGHWKTTTLVAGLTLRGMIAPFVLSGSIYRLAFDAYIKQVLAPELRPGDIAIFDNLSSQKSPKTRAMIEAAGAELLFLPPYSPTSTAPELPSLGSR